MSQPNSIDVTELAARRARGEAPRVLDVREAHELALASLPGVTHIPLHELPQRYEELDRQDEIVVMCHHGIRSAFAVQMLLSFGFARPLNLEGGIDQWSIEVDPDLPRY